MSYFTRVGLNSYLPTAATTECTLADVWYPAEGTFIRPVTLGFVIEDDLITFKAQPCCFEIIATSTISCDTNAVEVSMGISKNGTVPVNAKATIGIDKFGDIESLVLVTVQQLVLDDTIDLVLMSDAPGVTINLRDFHATIKSLA